jgi:hypothetical protein
MHNLQIVIKKSLSKIKFILHILFIDFGHVIFQYLMGLECVNTYVYVLIKEPHQFV